MALYPRYITLRKWRKDVDRHMLSPMYDDGSSHYYIDELARLKKRRFRYSLRWLEDNEGNVLADAYTVTLDNEVRYFRFQL